MLLTNPKQNIVSPVSQGQSHGKGFLKRQGERGAAAVEFALLLPFLMTLLLGIVDFGRVMFTQHALSHASRVGARQGTLFLSPRPSETDITAVVNSALSSSGYAPADATVTVVGAGGASGSDLQVTVAYPHDFIIISKVFPNIPDTMSLQGSTLMQLE